MKLSVNLPHDDVVILDEYARATGLASRSAALHVAVQTLRLHDLEEDYDSAWQEWQESGEGPVWENVSADGLVEALR